MTDTELLNYLEANLIQLVRNTSPLMGGQIYSFRFNNPEPHGSPSVRGNAVSIRDIPALVSKAAFETNNGNAGQK